MFPIFKGGHALTFRGLHILAIIGLHSLAFERRHVLNFRGLHALAFRGLRVLIFSVLHIRTLREFKGSHPQRHPVNLKKSNRALGFPALVTGLYQSYRGLRLQDTQWTRRSPTGSWSCQALITGLCQFYGVPVTSSKGIRPPTNRAFIKKYCVPMQAQGETPQQHWDGR
ncbi:hypothetical protein D0Y65_000831 [Glycine soja]|uniref:Uncharacterized protein n=1 Tax=Glycine soja TaxID=3848 RepID=A0A445M0B4_GLYSO|nr:hypothetical protein D0Y65_000831 [Glycine soja]